MSKYRSLAVAAWGMCVCSIAVLIGGELLVGVHRYALGVVGMLFFLPIYGAACKMMRHANRSRV